MIRALAAVGMMAALNACAIPPVISVAKLAADGVLLASTGKTSTDHGLSMAVGKDCETFRILAKEDVCQDEVVARVEPLPAEVARDRAAVEVLALTAPVDARSRGKLADQALAQAFRPHAAGREAGMPTLAVLPRPADSRVKVAVGIPGTGPKRLASHQEDASASKHGVGARPGLIKAGIVPPPKPVVTKVAVRGTVALPDETPSPGPGALESLGNFLGTAFRFGRSPE